jgi:sulfur-carrier protein
LTYPVYVDIRVSRQGRTQGDAGNAIEVRPSAAGLNVPTVTFTATLRRFLRVQAMRVEGATVGAALGAVFEAHPALRGYLLDDQGALRRHVAIYVGGEVVRGLGEAVGDDDTIHVFQALTGG